MPSTLRSSRIQRTSRHSTPPPNSPEPHTHNGIESDARRIVERHPLFRGRTDTISIEQRAGRLVLTGRLPSFYLKQQLQEAMRSINGMTGIENRVDVVSCNNLSSK